MKSRHQLYCESMTEEQKAKAREANRERKKKRYTKMKTDRMLTEGLDKFKPKRAGMTRY